MEEIAWDKGKGLNKMAYGPITDAIAAVELIESEAKKINELGGDPYYVQRKILFIAKSIKPKIESIHESLRRWEEEFGL